MTPSSGQGTEKVCSDDLFALASETGELKWRYHGGVVINSTIAIAGGKVLFVECRNPEVRALTTSRIGSREAVGEPIPRRAGRADRREAVGASRFDTADGIVVFYLLAAEDKVFLASSAAGKYHLYAFSAADGKKPVAGDPQLAQ